MENFNSAELKVGGLAMIVGSNHPENSWAIGKVVTIESIHFKGDSVPKHMLTELGIQCLDERPAFIEADCCVISADWLHFNPEFWRDGYSLCLTRNLMPLGDDESRTNKFQQEKHDDIEQKALAA